MEFIESILILRQEIIKIYKKYEYIIMPLVKFICLFIVLDRLRFLTNYSGFLGSVWMMLITAFIGIFLPTKWIILIGIIWLPIFMFSANPILASITFVALVILYLLYMRFFPKESLLIPIILIAFSFKMELLVVFLVAMFGKFICIASISIGTVLWYVIPQLSSLFQNTSLAKEEILDFIISLTRIRYEELFIQPNLLASLVVFFVVFSIIYIIRQQSLDYAPYIAIGVGSIMSIVGFGLAMLFLNNIGIKLKDIVVRSVLYGFIALIVKFFSKVLDYQRAEIVHFEDEENYYYVKVVPKINLTASHKKVKHVYNNKNEQLDSIKMMSQESNEQANL